MKMHSPNIIIILLLSFPISAKDTSLNEIAINEIFKKMREAKELYNSGKSVKSEKFGKEIENGMKMLFPNGKIISSNENCKFVYKKNSSFQNRDFGLSCIEKNFIFKFEGSSDVSFSDKKTLTPINIVEEFEELADGELFEGRIMIVSRGNNYSTYTISGNSPAPESIVVDCKILEIRKIKE